MNKIWRYIKENWPSDIVSISPDWKNLDSFGEKNRNFLLEVGLPLGVEDVIFNLTYTLCSIVPENIKMIESKWKYIAILGEDYSFGCMMDGDMVCFFENDYFGFVNSNLENMYYCIIKAHEAMLVDVDYTWLDLRRDYNELEGSRADDRHREFWESIIAWQLSEDEIYIEVDESDS